MPHQRFSSLRSDLDPLRTTPNEVAWEVYRDSMIPAISEVSLAIARRGEETSGPEVTAAATKMLAIWQELFERLNKRMGEEFPDMWDKSRTAVSTACVQMIRGDISDRR
jgi:hypothetical protein